jgi:molecular chaperone GrpE (heat shock protein)
VNEESDIQQEEVSEAACRLAQAFQELMEEYATDFPKEVSEQIVRLSNQISQVERKQQQSLHHFESIRQLLENTVSTNNLLEKAGEANQLLGQEHYNQHIIEPIVRSLFPVIDIIEDAYKSWKDNHCQTGQGQAELIEAIRIQLEQFLQNYGIEVILHQPNTQFNRQLMKPVSRSSTTDKRLDGLVAKSLQIGFRWNQQRLLRPESVSIYKYVEANIKSIADRKEGTL